MPSRSNFMRESLTTEIPKFVEPVRGESAFVDPSASSAATAHQAAHDDRSKLATSQDAETGQAGKLRSLKDLH